MHEIVKEIENAALSNSLAGCQSSWVVYTIYTGQHYYMTYKQ